ncbi:hypothetical protein TRVA0_090S00254 [Trichomonascus vanleenenianus]|uniref:N-terminal L-serine N(alpha)-acetyltransferase NatD n=1 Tax=Trichomonascus vanleenenianus TaxID=2268995 RepID=UPI003ECAF5EB
MTGVVANAKYYTSDTIPEDLFDQCYKLVRRIKPCYEASGMGWNAREKKAEMSQPNMSYLITTTDASKVIAFASFMLSTEFSYEDDDRKEFPVTYLYELHVDKAYHGHRLGSALLHQIKQMSTHNHLVLTVFRMNAAAIAFYKHHGFHVISEFEADASSRAKHITGWYEMELRSPPAKLVDA